MRGGHSPSSALGQGGLHSAQAPICSGGILAPPGPVHTDLPGPQNLAWGRGEGMMGRLGPLSLGGGSGWHCRGHGAERGLLLLPLNLEPGRVSEGLSLNNP